MVFSHFANSLPSFSFDLVGDPVPRLLIRAHHTKPIAPGGLLAAPVLPSLACMLGCSNIRSRFAPHSSMWHSTAGTGRPETDRPTYPIFHDPLQCWNPPHSSS